MHKISMISVMAVAGLVTAAGVASADTVLVTMRYDSLAGSYDSAMNQFEAHAVNSATLKTSGSVSRLVPTAGTAMFEPGFVSGANPADFNINVTAMPTMNPSIRTGTGTFTSIDRDGDMITGNVTGTWVATPVYTFFNGSLSNVRIIRSMAEGTTFNGTDGGSWDLGLPAPEPYTGAVIQLVFGNPNFFNTSFSNRATGLTAQLVPAPGALALVGLGGLAMARRRR